MFQDNFDRFESLCWLRNCSSRPVTQNHWSLVKNHGENTVEWNKCKKGLKKHAKIDKQVK